MLNAPYFHILITLNLLPLITHAATQQENDQAKEQTSSRVPFQYSERVSKGHLPGSLFKNVGDKSDFDSHWLPSIYRPSEQSQRSNGQELSLVAKALENMQQYNRYQVQKQEREAGLKRGVTPEEYREGWRWLHVPPPMGGKWHIGPIRQKGDESHLGTKRPREGTRDDEGHSKS